MPHIEMQTEEGLQNLLEKISAMYDMNSEEVKGHNKDTRLGDERLIDIRHVVCVIAKHRSYNYSEIARFIGMDHSSVQYYCKDRPKDEKIEYIIKTLTDTTTLIKKTAKSLHENPDDDYLKRQMLRLITNQL